jgi:hypothetical protein
MATSDMVLDSIESSNMPSRDKSMVRRMFDKVSGVSRVGSRARGTMQQAAHTARQGGEAIVTGAILGAIHVEAPTGLDVKKVPVDLAVAAVGLASGVLMNDETSQDLRNVGSTALGIYTFRKTADLLAAKKVSAGSTPGGSKPAAKVHGDYDGFHGDDVGEDPIVEAARRL